MTPGGLPASLPGRLTESSLKQGQDLPGARLIVGRARGAVPLDGGKVHLNGLHPHIADLVQGDCPPPQRLCWAPKLTIEVKC